MQVEDCLPGLIAYSTTKMAAIGLMVGLAAELHDSGIRINAISPVAATRVLRRSSPELSPELVAPGVAFLASSACGVSGAVLHGAGGRFSTSSWDRSDEHDLGSIPASPEEIAFRWRQIAGTN
jgi:NAD(P)-dependent dehydrogenase (short-subunit alcohol dehydrogenase family)